MRIQILISAIVITISSCSSNDKPQIESFMRDEKLFTSWMLFRDALNKSDAAALMTLSNKCIYSLEADTVMSSEQFYNRYSKKLFSKNFLPYINDTAKVSASYDITDWKESYDCLLETTGLKNAKLANIHVSIPLPGQKEGLTILLHFIETKTGYKFCGHYSIP